MPLQELSLFFPCHNEAENLEALVADALAALPALATTYEVILVDDGSRDDTANVAERLVQQHGGIGLTMEYVGGHYFRRLTAIEAIFGNTDYHLERFSAL